MAVTCRDVLDLKEFDMIQLVAGETGCDHLVSWPYIKQTKYLKDWIYGGELVFIMGIGDGTRMENLIETVEECVQNNAAGLVVLCGKKHVIKYVPEDARRRADKLGLPVYEMPFELKIIDVTRAISNRIVLDELKGQKTVNFMSDLLYDNYISEELLEAEGRSCGFQLNRSSFFAVFGVQVKENKQLHFTNLEQHNVMHSFSQLVERISVEKECVMLHYVSFNMSVCLFQVDNEQQQEELIQEIDKILQKTNRENTYKIGCGYSEIHQKCAGIREGFAEGRQALHMAFNRRNERQGYRYQEIGILKFLINSTNREKVIAYCMKVLKNLKDSDTYHQTEYVDTVYAYIMNNGNLVHTAEALYIHRNTLINRMKKIESITGKDFDNVNIRNEYYDVFRILEFYGK